MCHTLSLYVTLFLTKASPYATLCHTITNYVTLCHTMSHCVTLCHSMSHCVTLMTHYVTLCHTMSHYVTLCHTMSHYVTLCHTMSHCVTLYLTNVTLYPPVRPGRRRHSTRGSVCGLDTADIMSQSVGAGPGSPRARPRADSEDTLTSLYRHPILYVHLSTPGVGSRGRWHPTLHIR